MSSTLSYYKIIKLESYSMIKSVGIYLLLLITLNIAGVSMITFTFVGENGDYSYSGFDILITGAIFIGAIVAESFSDNFKLLIQNGFTRREIFISHTTFFIITSLIISISNSILLFTTQNSDIFGFTILFYRIYDQNITMLSGTILNFVLYLSVATITYMYIILYNRYNKKIVGLCWLLAVIVIAFIVYTAIQILPGEIVAGTVELLLAICGFTENGKTTINPTIAIGMIAAAHSLVSWGLLRKMEV